MPLILRRNAPPVKPVRRRTADPHPFGAGILRFVPSVGRMPFTIEDLAAAAQMFADAATDRENRRLEERAQQARWDDQFGATVPVPAGCCELCGEPADWLDPVHQLCDPCMTAAENATIACQNKTAMGQYRVF